MDNTNQPTIIQPQPQPVPVVVKPTPVKVPKPEETRRLTVDLPVSLHRRIKVKSVMEDSSVQELVRKALERSFPEPKVN